MRWFKANMLAVGVASCLIAGAASADINRGSSRAYGLSVDLRTPLAQATLNDRGNISDRAPAPYDRSRRVLSATLSLGGLVTLDTGVIDTAISSNVDSAPGDRMADASAVINGLDMTILPSLVSLDATTITANALVSGDRNNFMTVGDSILEDLTLHVLGVEVLVDVAPAPNTVLFHAAGITIIANEQIIRGTGVNTRTLEVNAIHISVRDVLSNGALLSGDVIIGHAQVTLSFIPCGYVNRGESAWSALDVDVSTLLADAELFDVGGISDRAPRPYDRSRIVASASLDVPLLISLSTGIISGNISSNVNRQPGDRAADADGVIDGLDLTVVPGLLLLPDVLSLDATTVTSAASVTGNHGNFATAGNATIENATLHILDLATIQIASNPAPNTVVFDALGIRVVANEQTLGGNGSATRSLSVNAIAISFDDVLAGGSILNGRIEIGHTQAFLRALAPCPSPLMGGDDPLAELDAFMEAFDAGGMEADSNGDGVLTGRDIELFLADR